MLRMSTTPPTFPTVGIVGTGAMGRGIAQIAAQAGSTVVLFDTQPAAIEKAREAAHNLARMPAAAVQDSKRLMKAAGRAQIRQVIEDESWLFIQRLSSPEAVAALSGFMNKA